MQGGMQQHLGVFFSFPGCLFFTLLYRQLFSPDISGYFLMITILRGLVNTAAILLVRKADTRPPNYEPTEFTTLQENPTSVLNGYGDSDLLEDQSQKERERTKPWLTCKFHLLFWIFIFSASIVHAQIVSLSTFSDSLGFHKETTWIISMVPILAAITTFLGGLISDYYLDKAPRMTITLVINIFTLVQSILSIFFIDQLWVLILLALSIAMMELSFSALIPSELHKQVGHKYYGTSFGAFYFVQAVLTIPLQYVTSLFYDLELRKQQTEGWTGTVCQGKACFTYGFILYSVVYVLCFALNVFYVYKKY